MPSRRTRRPRMRRSRRYTRPGNYYRMTMENDSNSRPVIFSTQSNEFYSIVPSMLSWGGRAASMAGVFELYRIRSFWMKLIPKRVGPYSISEPIENAGSLSVTSDVYTALDVDGASIATVDYFRQTGTARRHRWYKTAFRREPRPKVLNVISTVATSVTERLVPMTKQWLRHDNLDINHFGIVFTVPGTPLSNMLSWELELGLDVEYKNAVPLTNIGFTFEPETPTGHYNAGRAESATPPP